MPTISVVMPTYNAEKYLKEAIDSILNQTYTDFEFLIIDDNSTDKTRDIIKSYSDPRIKLIYGPCRGIAAALNLGLELAQGEYVARMDADDISLPERFEKQVEFMDNNNDVILCSGLIQFFDNTGLKDVIGAEKSSQETKIELLFATPIFHPTVLFRNKEFKKQNLKYDETLKAAEDYDLWTRVSINNNIQVLPNVLLNYRVGNNKATTFKQDLTRENHAKIIKNIFSSFGVKLNTSMCKMLDPLNDLKEFNNIQKRIILKKIIRSFKDLQEINDKRKHFNSYLLNDLLNMQIKYIKSKLYNNHTFTRNRINVCMASNEKWSPLVAVTIISILKNTNSFINFFILETDIKQSTKRKISLFNKKYDNCLNIEFIKIDKDKWLQGFKADVHYISIDSFSRFVFPYVKPDIKKVIYTDIDVVFMKDISLLYNINLDNYIIGAVPGPYHANGSDNERLGIPKTHSYFQSGLLLIDCEKWRKFNIIKDLLIQSNDKTKTTKYGDQDLLNLVFQNNYKKLDYAWCFMPMQKNLFLEYNNETRTAVKSPAIIHYCGQNKPMNSKGEYDNFFWEYAIQTPFYKDLRNFTLKSKLNLIQNIFSIKNQNIHKIITILGIKLKFKSQKLILRKQLEDIKNTGNNIINKENEIENNIQDIKNQIDRLTSFEQKLNNIENNIANIENKINHINQNVVKTFQYTTGIQLNKNFVMEREILFDPKDAPKDHYNRYVFAKDLINDGDVVADIACTCGYGSKIISEKVAKVIGVDINQPVIDFANKVFANDKLSFLCQDAQDLKLDIELDAVVSFETIEHIPQPELFLKAVNALLKQNGKLIVSVPNETTRPWAKEANEFHYRHYTKDQISDLLANCGFVIDNIYEQYEDDNYAITQKNYEGQMIIVIARKV